MTHRECITMGIFGAIILFTTSMFGRIIYDQDKLVECKAGKYTFMLERKDCRHDFAYKLRRIKIPVNNEVFLQWVHNSKTEGEN
jgi:hypothetical protein